MSYKLLIKKILLIILLVFVCLLLISFRFLLIAKSEWRISQDFLNKKNVSFAIPHLDFAIRNYFLFSPYAKRATIALNQIAENFEKDKNLSEAFNTYQTLLSALCSVRHPFFSPPISINSIESKMDQLKNKIISESQPDKNK